MAGRFALIKDRHRLSLVSGWGVLQAHQDIHGLRRLSLVQAWRHQVFLVAVD